ncbi:MAG TPA: FAD-linked oxidase C-terminal domain-containing protein, partial [Polyangiaceae bacterium]|nr:FAD-linked oxidase C-terminal domain-containing protein [Polyangiaceae bacterium]
VTCATFRLHRAPTERAFGAWSFPTTRHGWEAMRAMFQSGLRPAVARVYDPFDAMLARRGRVQTDDAAPRRTSGWSPGVGAALLRSVLRRPGAINDLLDSTAAAHALGGAMLVLVFEVTDGAGEDRMDEARRIARDAGGAWEGPDAARAWFEHRYAVSYRQAPVFANGAFVDTMEVAAPWSKLEGLFEAVRRALSRRVFVMAHLSHAYPDGCCIYFSFAGAAHGRRRSDTDWDAACTSTYDLAWRGALAAAIEAGGTLAHHHGVGRSKAPRLRGELGEAGADLVRGLMHAFDPKRVLNPGALIGAPEEGPVAPPPSDDSQAYVLDRQSMLARAGADLSVAELDLRLGADGFTLDATAPEDGPNVGEWLARGAPGSRDPWLDPVDHRIAGLDATLPDGRALRIPPAPRRSVGPDLTALFVGGGGRFGEIRRAWLRVHPRGAGGGVRRPACTPLRSERAPPLGEGERRLLDCVERAIGARGR